MINIDETGLYWKEISAKTLIAKVEKTASGFKASKDRIPFLLTSEAASDLELKPVVIYHSPIEH